MPFPLLFLCYVYEQTDIGIGAELLDEADV